MEVRRMGSYKIESIIVETEYLSCDGKGLEKRETLCYIYVSTFSDFKYDQLA